MARLLQRPDVAVVSNPEFLREGTALHDALHPDRIVVGADDPEVEARVGARFSATGVPLIVTDARTAETITYASNAFLATKLRLANAVARMCEAVGADTRGVLLGMGYDHRIGSDYLRPGPARAGAGRAGPRTPGPWCTWPRRPATASTCCAASSTPTTRTWAPWWTGCDGPPAVRSTVRWWRPGASPSKPAPTIGATRRPSTSCPDWRPRAPGCGATGPAPVAPAPLASEGARMRVYDPTVSGPVPELPEQASVCRDPYGACDGASALVLLTEWELRWADFAKVRSLLATPAVVDTRNLLDPGAVRRLGIACTGVRRP